MTTTPSPISLSESDRKRLEHFAPHFDVLVQEEDSERVTLRVLDRGGWRESQVPAERLHTRLLTELCSKTLRWVYFPLGKPCNEALLGLADTRLARIAELYNQQKDVLLGLNSDSGSGATASLQGAH